MPPSAGTVELMGTTVDQVPEGLAMVFQDYTRSLYSWLTVAKNVAFPLPRGRRNRAMRLERVRDSLEAVGLGPHAARYPFQLSGGMQQRVAIAHALACAPKLLLMDEPLASVDAQTRANLEDLALKVFDEFDITVLFVTHDIDESVYLADRVMVLSKPPSALVADVSVGLQRPWDQITTRESEEFVQLRGAVARLLRDGSPNTTTGVSEL